MTNSNYKELVLNDIPELKPEQVLCEPIARNTAPCIAYAAARLAKIDPEAQMIVTPSDHWIADEQTFLGVVGDCLEYTDKNDVLMTIGLHASYPATGYGYIQVSDRTPISKVKTFTEKPNLDMAKVFLSSGDFFWNSGIFIWQVKSIMEAFETHLPEHYQLFTSVNDKYGTPEEQQAIGEVFSMSPAISIDYGVMERAKNVYVRTGSFGWSDMGTWNALYDHLDKDESANASPKSCKVYNTSGTVVSLPKGKIAVIDGLKDYIVADTEDVLMICPRDKEQSINKYVEDLKYDGKIDKI